MAGSVTITSTVDHNRGYAILTAAWVGDADDSSVPDTALPSAFIDQIKGWYLYAIQTVPGADAEAPTADYDITLEDSLGMDLLGGAGGDRSATATEFAMPLWGSTPIPAPVYEGLTFKLRGNSVDEATGTARFIFVRGMFK